MATTTLWTAGILLIIAIVLVQKALARPKAAHPLPPGPKPIPLLGNIKDIPPPNSREWEHWLKHKELYGPISSLSVMGTTMIILNDAKLALELMEKRSNIHSSRPKMVFGGEMCGWKDSMIFQDNSDRLRLYRKQFHSMIGTKNALQRFVPLQEVEAHRFLLRVIQKPKELVQHIRTEAGAIILKIAYGYTIESHRSDPLVDLADRALDQFTRACIPGAWLVDTIPALRYLPDWMPGSGFKQTAREWKDTLMRTAKQPMKFVKQQMDQNQHEPSFLAGLYENAGEKMTAEEEDSAMWSAVSLYTGGADTTVSTLQTFFLAMLLHPEIQRKAREEIERVVGKERLPKLDDRKNLPYIDAIVSESLRWHTVAPLGMPHVTSAEDVCNGYRIPKGALLLPNIWWYTHDPNTYQQPSHFNPDRFLGKTPEPDPRTYVFGFGRRICPGRLLADSSLWLTIANSLAALDIRKARDQDGREVEPEVQFEPSLISHPVPFEADIKPRDAKYEGLILEVETLYPWEKSNSDELENINGAPLGSK